MQAGLIRRVAALYLDLAVAVVPALLLLFLPGVFVPLDRSFVWLNVAIAPAVLAALAYVFAGPALLGNTYGRYAMGIRVVDDGTGARPRLGQALVRTLTVGLWPVEAVLVAVSPTRRRLGDRWAGTSVVRYEAGAPWSNRVLPALGVIGAGICLYALTPVIAGRMDVARAAAAYARQARDGEPAGPPGRVLVENDRASVELRFRDGGTARVRMVRERGRWRGERTESIPREEMGRGFSISKGVSSVHGGS